jgi:hypothetical protein
VLDTLTELKLKPDKIDAPMQTVVTRAASYGGRTVKPPDVPGYVPQNLPTTPVRVAVRGAGVHLGSISEMRKNEGGSATLYNGGVAEEWFLGRWSGAWERGDGPFPRRGRSPPARSRPQYPNGPGPGREEERARRPEPEGGGGRRRLRHRGPQTPDQTLQFRSPPWVPARWCACAGASRAAR